MIPDYYTVYTHGVMSCPMTTDVSLDYVSKCWGFSELICLRSMNLSYQLMLLSSFLYQYEVMVPFCKGFVLVYGVLLLGCICACSGFVDKSVNHKDYNLKYFHCG